MSVGSKKSEAAAPGATVSDRNSVPPRRPAAIRATGPSSPNDRRKNRRWGDRVLLPSWLVSLTLHLTLMLAVALTAKGPPGFGKIGEGPITISAILGDGPAAGLPGEGTGQPKGPGMGIFLGPGPGTASEQAGDGGEGEGDDPEASVADSLDQKSARDKLDEEPPVELDLPAAPNFTRYGPGPGSFGESYRDAREIVKAAGRAPVRGNGNLGSAGGGDEGPAGGGGQGGSRGGQGGTGHGGGTSFFGHQANGTRFVYVLDASGSMFDYNAISVAKAELLASLEQLEPTQQFAIIFYNDRVHPLRTPEGKEGLFWGTDTNRTFASQFIRGVRPDGGTRHLDALLMALGYGPEVIFFLTDAGEPVLYPGDLDKIKKRNNGRSRIFTIEFGKGANLRADNFLKKLARENGGSHAYRDVQEFEKR